MDSQRFQIPETAAAVNARLTQEEKTELNTVFSEFPFEMDRPPSFRDALLALVRRKPDVTGSPVSVINPDTEEMIRVNSGMEDLDAGIHEIFQRSQAREDLIGVQALEIEQLRSRIAELEASKQPEIVEGTSPQSPVIQVQITADEIELLEIIAERRSDKFQLPQKSAAETLHDLALAKSTIHNYGGGFYTGV